MMKRCFPDVNVWFALAVADHPHHSIAVQWWNDHTALTGFSRLTQLGLLRLLTTASAMDGAPLTNAAAWEVFDAFALDERVRMFPELPTVDESFRLLSSEAQSSPKVWADAYFAAYASANQASIITFDRGFQRFDIEQVILG
jgi:uncharacterized protein